ncbi:MAG: DUF72 domain-containing protein [Methylobacteriaceae bacterium]|nr:DUF72 domain-containing protein [Methylobacteriaceae bacterium]
MDAKFFVGTAGWGVDRRYAAHFPAAGSHLERYSRTLSAAEINSSFHRPHRRSTYERWAESVPEDFRFCVKLPKTITHERRLVGCDSLLDAFVAEVAGLGLKLGCMLVQLPPKLAFDEEVVAAFFSALRERISTALACEPRHATWFEENADRALAGLQVARVAADPPRAPSADAPGGWPGLIYYRLHGSPRIYYSAYGDDVLAKLAATLAASARDGVPAWCMFDNTMSAAATGNALTLQALLGKAA